jgi:hypothetical protein
MLGVGVLDNEDCLRRGEDPELKAAATKWLTAVIGMALRGDAVISRICFVMLMCVFFLFSRVWMQHRRSSHRIYLVGTMSDAFELRCKCSRTCMGKLQDQRHCDQLCGRVIFFLSVLTTGMCSKLNCFQLASPSDSHGLTCFTALFPFRAIYLFQSHLTELHSRLLGSSHH